MSRYLQPANHAELAAALGQMTDASVIIAGGTDLMIMIRKERPETDLIISLSKVPELRGIGIVSFDGPDGGEILRIGAMETHDRIARDPLVQQYFTALSRACASVGSQQIRNRGTIGGNLCNATPADDTMPCVTLFGGLVEIMDAGGDLRTVPVKDLVTDFGATCLSAGEVVTAVLLPVKPGQKSAFVKLGSRKAVTIAQLSMAAAWTGAEDVSACLGAASLHPIEIPEIREIIAATGGNPARAGKAAEALGAVLGSRIQEVRRNRKRPPRLKITEDEQLYKERAAIAVADDICRAILG